MAQADKADLQTEEIYERICGICFTEVDPVENPRGRINSCNHLFCSYCIKEWAKRTNACPSCKARFTRIYTKHPGKENEEEVKVRRRNYTSWPSEDSEDDSQLGENMDTNAPQVFCDVCHEGHSAVRMIMCDRRECTYTAHLECIGLTTRPLTFLCPSCSRKGLTESSSPGRLSTNSTTEEPSPVEPAPTHPRASTPPRPQRPRRPLQASRKIPMHSPLAHQPASQVEDATARHSAPAPQHRMQFTTLPASRGAVDFSKLNLMHLEAPPSSHNRHAERDGNGEDADLYFLKPTTHSETAKQHLHDQKEAQKYMSQQRQQVRDDKTRRMYESRDYNAILHHHRITQRSFLPKEASKRGQRSDPVQENLTEIAEIDRLLGDDHDRLRTEDKMTYEWAAEMVPVLRRNGELESARLRLNPNGEVDLRPPLTTAEVEARESALWDKALKQARPMVQQKIKQSLYSLRKRKQELLDAQAQRESAALAKLARMIALHRARTGA